MKFLIDECVGRFVFNWLKSKGVDVVFVKDEFEGFSDDFVLAKAISEKRILITCDKDFGDMVFRDKKKHIGIILLRLIDESSVNKVRVLEEVFANYKDEIDNNFLILSENNVRIIKFDKLAVF